MSRHHVEFRRSADGFSIRDLGSLNGTYVNRSRIDDTALVSGDEVQIGKYRLQFLTGGEQPEGGVMSPAAGQRASTIPARAYLSIGEVLAKLRPEFSDVTISKIRFLESEGLIEPQRTPSGYRKFTPDDIQRLRYVLSAQRDQYLPLKVIREHLEAMDRGLEPPASSWIEPACPGRRGAWRRLPRGRRLRARRRRPAAVARRAAGHRRDRRRPPRRAGELRPDRRAPNGEHYDGDAVVVAKAAGELATYGIEPRHLRAFKSAADREAGLIEQVVTPLLRGRGADAKGRAEETTRTLAALSVRLHAALVKAQLGPDLRS